MTRLFHISRFFCTFAGMETKKKQIIFIVNPISGTKSKEGLEGLIKATIDTNKFDWKIVKTEYAGHAAELARSYAEQGIDIVVAVGGDGTVNEVARSLAQTQTALGIVPCGSGNGLARHLCLPMNIKKSLQIINQAHIIDIDYAMANDQAFFCTCGMGFDAHVALLFANSGSRGLSTYAKLVLREGMTYQPSHYVVRTAESDEELHIDAFLLDVGNAAQYGNNTYIAPGASVRDGLLNLVFVEQINKPARIKLMTDLFTKTIDTNKHVTVLKSTAFYVHREADAAFQFDGDPMVAGTDFDIRIVPAGLKVVANGAKIEDKAKPNKLQSLLFAGKKVNP